MTPESTGQGRPRLGLASRLALLASALVLIVLAAIGLATDAVLAQRAHAEMRGRSFALLESLAVSCAFDIADGAIERLDDALTELSLKGREQLDIESVALLDTKGTAIAHSGAGTFAEAIAALAFKHEQRVLEFATESASAERARWLYAPRQDGMSLLILSMPVISGLRWGTLVAVFDLARVNDRIVTSRYLILAAALAIALTLVLALQAGLVTLVVRPLRRLRATVSRLEAGDFTARAEVGARTEIGQLGRAFNQMASELESYTRNLEERVAQRTAESERRREELESVNARLEIIARTDLLTGLANRRHVLEQLELELGRARRHQHSLALAMVDIDHFKRVNDTWGHASGDAVLKAIGETLKRSVRAHDLVGRHGGEEFIVALLEPLPVEVPGVLERLRSEVEAVETILPDGRSVKVTISCGYAIFPDHDASLDGLLSAADKALYRAKHEGRNRVIRAISRDNA
jgi:diguanylate cyclase (GGDEF)-like protein